MSISYCRFVEAYETNNTKLFKKLAFDVYREVDDGKLTAAPCEHDPPCRQLTEKEFDQINDFMAKIIEGDGKNAKE